MDVYETRQLLALQLFIRSVEDIANRDLDPLDEPHLMPLANLAVGCIPP
jgi:hypothetical protein